MNRPPTRWRQVLGINARNDHIDRVNPLRAVRLVNDKHATKVALATAGLPVPPTLAILADRRALAGLDWGSLPESWALKPNHGRGGCGILLAGRREGDGWTTVSGRALPLSEVLEHVRLVLQGEFSPAGRLRDSALLEPLLVPTPRLARIVPAGMPDLRVVCQAGRPISAMLRLPTVRSGGRANLHQGGLGAAVDVATGRVTGARWRGRACSEHPDTGAGLVGLRVPAWRQVLAEAAACAEVTGLGYLGVDVVFDRDRGRLVLEVNARPGLEIQNVQGWGLAQLVRDVVPGPVRAPLPVPVPVPSVAYGVVPPVTRPVAPDPGAVALSGG